MVRHLKPAAWQNSHLNQNEMRTQLPEPPVTAPVFGRGGRGWAGPLFCRLRYRSQWFNPALLLSRGDYIGIRLRENEFDPKGRRQLTFLDDMVKKGMRA